MHLTVQSAKHALTASLVRPKHRAGLNATVEDRIRVLESSIDTLELRVDNLQQQIDQVNREGNQGLVTERDIRERDIAELKESLETVETGGVFLSLIGLLWLSIGLIMSTASVEISRLF
jgi:predicted RNase H-like nuclease (RuvC/YqgF family)